MNPNKIRIIFINFMPWVHKLQNINIYNHQILSPFCAFVKLDAIVKVGELIAKSENSGQQLVIIFISQRKGWKDYKPHHPSRIYTIDQRKLYESLISIFD